MATHDELDAPDEAVENWGETVVTHAPFYRTL
jgi:hypothetical protein